MAHKTLINGTAYSIVGGSTLVSGTAYSISAGKTLISGTAYSIPIASGSSFSWGTNGDTVDAQWFADLKAFCESATPAEIANSIPIGGWKTVTLSSPIWGSTSHYISVIGVNQDLPQSVTFWDSPSVASAVSGGTVLTYDNWWGTGPHLKIINDWLPAFPGKDYLATVTKGRYNASSYSYSSSYNSTISQDSVKAWSPSFDELQGEVTPQSIGHASGTYNPASFSLVESNARYSWPPTKITLYSNNTAWPIPTRTAVTSSSGSNNITYTMIGSANDPASGMSLSNSGNQYSMGCCFCVGVYGPFSWPGWSNATWRDVNNLCVLKKNGRIANWPADIEVGIEKSITFSAAVGGTSTFDAILIGIEHDGAGVLTFMTKQLTANTIQAQYSPYGSIKTPYMVAISRGTCISGTGSGTAGYSQSYLFDLSEGETNLSSNSALILNNWTTTNNETVQGTVQPYEYFNTGNATTDKSHRAASDMYKLRGRLGSNNIQYLKMTSAGNSDYTSGTTQHKNRPAFCICNPDEADPYS